MVENVTSVCIKYEVDYADRESIEVGAEQRVSNKMEDDDIDKRPLELNQAATDERTQTDSEEHQQKEQLPAKLLTDEKTLTSGATKQLDKLDTRGIRRLSHEKLRLKSQKWMYRKRQLDLEYQRFEWKKKLEEKKLEMEQRKIQGQLQLDYQKLANEHELRVLALKYKYGK